MKKAILIFTGLLLIFQISCSDENIVGERGYNYSYTAKAEILQKYAPRLWYAIDEIYFPSSVEWAFPNLKRVKIGGNYWLVTKSPLLGKYLLEGPNYKDVYDHTYFHGNLESSVIYGFWVEKLVGPEGEKEDIIDLVYYIFYPYNKGKSCGGVRYENHVGDWEYLVVRLDKYRPDPPLKVALSAHDFVGVYDWDEIDKVGQTHVIAHVAWGSHGIWKDAGSHHYDTIVCELHDYCSKGTLWDTWHSIETFDFNSRRGIGRSEWPSWMSDEFSLSGSSNPYDPAAGAIYRWGNPENYCWAWACVLTTGPTGPISKGVFYSEGFE